MSGQLWSEDVGRNAIYVQADGPGVASVRTGKKLLKVFYGPRALHDAGMWSDGAWRLHRHVEDLSVAVKGLLNCTDLSTDELDDTSRTAIQHAGKVLAAAEKLSHVI